MNRRVFFQLLAGGGSVAAVAAAVAAPAADLTLAEVVAVSLGARPSLGPGDYQHATFLVPQNPLRSPGAPDWLGYRGSLYSDR